MGSLTTRDHALHLRLKGNYVRMGWGVGMNDVQAVLRALPSLAPRYAAQDAAGRTLAMWWQRQPQVSRVLHPALPGWPGHTDSAALCSQVAGLFSVVFDECRERNHVHVHVHALVDALQLFKLGCSWAGPVSLAVPYDLGVIRPGSTWRGTLVRYSLGLEANVGDLQDDLAAALRRTFGTA